MAANIKDEGIADEVVDQLLAGRDPATVFENGGLIDELKKRLAERMLNAELDHHLGNTAEEDAGNHRNGYGSKTVITDTGKLELAIPRDRHGRFDPVLIGKYRRRFAGFDDKIIALYARGMTTRGDRRAYRRVVRGGDLGRPGERGDRFGTRGGRGLAEPGPGCDLCHRVLRRAAGEDPQRRDGQQPGGVSGAGRTLLGAQGDPRHLDRADRRGEVLAAGNERAAQPRGPGPPDCGGRWAQGLSRGDRLGVSQDRVQTCIVHLIRYSMQFTSWKEHRLVAAALKSVYQAQSAAAARERLEDFDRSRWGQKYPAIAQSWRRNWEQVIPFFAFAPELRKILYTTNAIESLNAQVRKAVRIRGHFPSEEAATKLIYLVLRKVQARWKNPPIAWQAAKTQLAIQFEDRFQVAD